MSLFESLQKKIRRVFSVLPGLYEGAAILKLIGLRFKSSPKKAISAILLVKSKRGLALDIGANRGQSAIRITKLKPDFKIISFEPNPNCQLGLRIAKFLLGMRFEFRMAGVSDVSGEMEYYEPYINSLAIGAEGTFLFENLDEEMQARLGKQLEIKKKIVPVLRLDDLKLSPDFIKIDVQGWELNVLRGAHDTICSSHPVLLVERNRHNELETMNYLKQLGYRKLDEEDLLRSGIPHIDISGDNVFAHREAVGSPDDL